MFSLFFQCSLNTIKKLSPKELKEEFDGHANCFVETGNGKALLIDFNLIIEIYMWR